MKTFFFGNSGGIQGIKGSNTSFALKAKNALLLIDASGSPIESLAKCGLDPLALDAVLLTHEHIDHIYAIPSLLHNLWLLKRQRALVIAGNEAVLAKAEALIEFFSIPQKKNMFPILFQKLEDREVFTIEDLKIETFPVEHGVKTNGFCFSEEGRKLVYSADCNEKSVFPQCAYQPNVLIHEATFEKKPDHSTAEEAAQVALRIKSEKLLLVHLPQDEAQRMEILKKAKELFSNTEIPCLFEGIEI